MPKISIVLPVLISQTWQLIMTEMCIRLMRECTDVDHELIIVETKSEYLEKFADKYIYVPERANPTADINLGIDAAEGEYVIYIGNDIMVKPNWIEALLACFEIKDCGIATLAAHEPGSTVGSRYPIDKIVEGMYGPLMMFPANLDNQPVSNKMLIKDGWRFDEAYESQCADNDLVMRAYTAGMRAYRNNAAVVHHLDGQTWDHAYTDEDRARITQEGRALFEKRWKDSPLWMAKMIRTGHVLYSKEHE